MLGKFAKRIFGAWRQRLGFRYEQFGGIIHLTWPRALVFVDRARARALGYAESPRWVGGESEDALLAAPLEAHLQLTNRCDTGCQGCYTGASPEGAKGEWGAAEWKRAIDVLADQGVFHLALGGGESALLPWLGEVAAHARARGLVPNLTTSGVYGEAELARLVGWAPLFGQINVSVDGPDAASYRAVRGVDGFAAAERAILRLRAAKREVGINCVVTRGNFDTLDALFAAARRWRLNQIELLRLKPAGRGTRVYEALRCTDAQHRRLLPTVMRAAARHRMRVHLDCSYVPMVASQKPSRALLRWLAIYGCVGGDHLIASKAGGQLAACSFAPPVTESTLALAEYWRAPQAFGEFRRWQAAAQPCASCEYHALCRGGCRVVAGHAGGGWAAPDPECPRVVDWRAARGGEAPRRLPVVQ